MSKVREILEKTAGKTAEAPANPIAQDRPCLVCLTLTNPNTLMMLGGRCEPCYRAFCSTPLPLPPMRNRRPS